MKTYHVEGRGAVRGGKMEAIKADVRAKDEASAVLAVVMRRKLARFRPEFAASRRPDIVHFFHDLLIVIAADGEIKIKGEGRTVGVTTAKGGKR